MAAHSLSAAASQARHVVRELDAGRVADWDAFVESCPEATFFHRAGWREVVARAFGHNTHFLFAERDGRIEGVLPLGHVRSRLFGNALISSPFCVYGGIAALDAAAAAALQQAAQALATRLGVDYLEFRNLEPRNPDWARKDLYVRFRKAIDPDPEANMLAIPRKQRAMVRKGIKAGLTSELDQDIDRFYAAYSESVHNLGTPVFSRRYFRILQEVFGDDCDILTITRDGELVSSVMNFYFRDEVLPYYGGGTAAARNVQGNDFMYWELMRRSCERGLKWFDYGRSKEGTGSYSFKKNWGFEPEPLHYEYWLVHADAMPNVSPTNPKYRLFIETWKRLPLPVTRLLGPWIARNLG
jgi:FemAB-related protein (PEP-CTERM system-associated)